MMFGCKLLRRGAMLGLSNDSYRRKIEMKTFNNGKPYHGSEAVTEGKLTGGTDTDYFYFFCPECEGKQVLQILDFDVVRDGPVEYAPENRPGAKRDFVIAFQLRCHKCGLKDFVKVSNMGWQGGQITKSLALLFKTTQS
jgi:hypothetical protein